MQVLTLLSEASPATLHAPGRVGALTPLATTSAGRVLAGELADEELDALGLGDAREAIALARAEGYAIVREEFEAGVVAAAAPIRDAGRAHRRRAQRLGAELPLRAPARRGGAVPRRGRRRALRHAARRGAR